MISIIIPVYNDNAELRHALAYIAKQTFRDFEVIVVDDGSELPLSENPKSQIPNPKSQFYRGSPDTIEDPRHCRDSTESGQIPNPKFQILFQAHKGASAARNLGAKHARGEFLLFCDADARMRPNMLGRMHGALAAHRDASYAYSSFYFGWKKFTVPAFDPERLQSENYIHTTALIRREHFPGFDESLARFQDWDLWLAMLESGRRGIAIPETLFRIARTRGTMSRWIPTFGYRWPWSLLWRKRVEDYVRAKEIIQKKHMT